MNDQARARHGTADPATSSTDAAVRTRAADDLPPALVRSQPRARTPAPIDPGMKTAIVHQTRCSYTGPTTCVVATTADPAATTDTAPRAMANRSRRRQPTTATPSATRTPTPKPRYRPVYVDPGPLNWLGSQQGVSSDFSGTVVA